MGVDVAFFAEDRQVMLRVAAVDQRDVAGLRCAGAGYQPRCLEPRLQHRALGSAQTIIVAETERIESDSRARAYARRTKPMQSSPLAGSRPWRRKRVPRRVRAAVTISSPSLSWGGGICFSK